VRGISPYKEISIERMGLNIEILSRDRVRQERGRLVNDRMTLAVVRETVVRETMADVALRIATSFD
jgi:hypothetical protein